MLEVCESARGMSPECRGGTADVVLAGGDGFATSFALCLALPAAVRELKRQN